MPGFKMKDYRTPWMVQAYKWLKGVYVIDDDQGNPLIYGIDEGTNPPAIERIPADRFPVATFPFGQINSIGGGRELLAPWKQKILPYVAVCLTFPGLAYNSSILKDSMTGRTRRARQSGSRPL